MAAKVIYKKNEYEICAGITIRAALEKLRIQPEAVVSTKNGELINEDETIKDGDVIRLVAVISGG
jgi:sulfur carrier protein ThiS